MILLNDNRSEESCIKDNEFHERIQKWSTHESTKRQTQIAQISQI